MLRLARILQPLARGELFVRQSKGFIKDLNSVSWDLCAVARAEDVFSELPDSRPLHPTQPSAISGREPTGPGRPGQSLRSEHFCRRGRVQAGVQSVPGNGPCVPARHCFPRSPAGHCRLGAIPGLILNYLRWPYPIPIGLLILLQDYRISFGVPRHPSSAHLHIPVRLPLLRADLGPVA